MKQIHPTSRLMMLLAIFLLELLNPYSPRAGQDDFKFNTGTLAADIFRNEDPSTTEPSNMDKAKEDDTPLPAASILLFFGIVLLASSGREYAGRHRQAHAELRQIQSGLEALIDDSVLLTGGTQFAELHRQLEELAAQKATIAEELQTLHGEQSC